MTENVNDNKNYNMDNLKKIINSEKANVQVYLIKKQKDEYTCKIFPNQLKENIKEMYRENFNKFITFKDNNKQDKEKSVLPYDNIHTEKGTIQFDNINDNDIWLKVKKSIEEAKRTDDLLNKKNLSDQYNMIVICFEDCIDEKNEKIYLIAKYIKIENWYKKSMKLSFAADKFKEFNKEIFILNGCIDCAIIEDEIYIFLENNVEVLFKFNKKIVKILEENKDTIEKCSFVNNPVEFYNLILQNKKATRYMARVLTKKNFDFEKLTPESVKKRLSQYNEFKDISYDDKERIEINAKSRDIIINILRKVFVRDLFSEQIFETKGI